MQVQDETAPRWIFIVTALAALLAAADLRWAGNGTLFSTLNANLGASLPAFWSALSASGDTLVALVLWLPLFLWRPRFFAVVLVALLPVGAAVHLLKHLVELPRPAAVLDPSGLVVLGPALKSDAFPSGHAATAFALVGMLAMARCRRLLLVAAAWAGGVGVARIAAGVHWPPDVLVGAVLGFAGGAFVYRWLAPRRWPASAGFRRVMLGVLALLCIALFFHTVHDALLDPWLPVLAGWGGGALLAALQQRRVAVFQIMGAGVGGAVLLFVLTRPQWGDVWQQMARTPPVYLLVPALALLLSYSLRAWRLRLQLARLQDRPWLALRLTLLHNAFNNLLPFRSGELSLPWMLYRHHLTSPALGVGLLGFMRIQDLAAIGFCLLWWGPAWALPVKLLLSVAIVGGLGLLPAVLLRCSQLLPRRWQQLARQVAAGAPRGRCLWQTSALTLCNWSCKLAGFAWLLVALLHVSPATALGGVVGAEMTSILPLHAPAGLGTWEAGLAAGVGLRGLPLAAVLPVALLLHALVLGLSLLSLLLLLPGPGRHLPLPSRS